MRNFNYKPIIIVIMLLFSLSGCSSNINMTEQMENMITSENIVMKEIPVYKNANSEGIQVKVYMNKSDVIYGFEISGHSGYAEYGSDIICAGVSAIAQNVLTSIKAYTKDKVEDDIKEGYLKCILPDMKKGNGSKEACVLLKSAAAGFYSIKSSYDEKYIKVYKVID